MTLNPNNLLRARKKGFSETEIIDSVARNFPDMAERIQKAKQSGFGDKEIVNGLIRTQRQQSRIESDKATADQLQQIGLQQPVSTPEELGIERQVFGDQIETNLPQQIATGALEGAIGTPGNIVQLLKGLGEALPEVPGFLNKRNPLQEFIASGLEKLPTSEEIRQFQEETAPRLTPDTAGQRVARRGGEFAGASAIFGPSQIVPGFVSGIASESAKEAGAGPVGQFFASVAGGLTASGLQNFVKNPKALKQFVDNLYDDMRGSIKPGETADARKLTNELTEFVNNLEIGGLTEAEKPAKNMALDFLRRIGPDNELELPALEKFIRRIREKKRDLSFFLPKDRQTARFFGQIEEKLKDTVKLHGSENAAFAENFLNADAAYAAMNKGSVLQKMLPKNFNLNKLEPATLVVTGLFSPALAKGLVVKAAGGSLVRLVQRINTSALRPFYAEVLKNAEKGNRAATVKSLLRFNEEVKKNPEIFNEDFN